LSLAPGWAAYKNPLKPNLITAHIPGRQVAYPGQGWTLAPAHAEIAMPPDAEEFVAPPFPEGDVPKAPPGT
jgi:hypothetical protein